MSANPFEFPTHDKPQYLQSLKLPYQKNSAVSSFLVEKQKPPRKIVNKKPRNEIYDQRGTHSINSKPSSQSDKLEMDSDDTQNNSTELDHNQNVGDVRRDSSRTEEIMESEQSTPNDYDSDSPPIKKHKDWKQKAMKAVQPGTRIFWGRSFTAPE